MTKPSLTELKKFAPEPPAIAGWVVLLGAFVWAYGSTMWLLYLSWRDQPDYGHGFFVPVFAVVLLWVRREMIDPLPSAGTLWGAPFLVLWALMRWTSAYYFYPVFDSLSLLPFLAGLTLIVGGWRAFRWAWPAIAFLVFMVPLPGVIAGGLRDPLRAVATKISVFAIQTLGIPAIGQGNVIQLTDQQLGVAEACSGLRMLMLFFAICVGAAFVMDYPLWKKVVIVVSAPVIAILANVARIIVTAILYEGARRWPGLISHEWANLLFHGGAGLFMMPLGLAMLWGEMALMNKLILDTPQETALALRGTLRETRVPVTRRPPMIGPPRPKQ